MKNRKTKADFIQFLSDDFEIAFRHSYNGPNQCPTSKFRFAKAFDIVMQKDHEEEGGHHVGEPGEDERVGIFEQFFLTWFSV